MHRTTTIVALAASGLLTAFASAQSTITVCSSGCDHTSIQSAIDAASNGDTIAIAAGSYYEGSPVDPTGKAVHLLGALNECGGPAVYIDGSGTHQVIACISGETTETQFENLVIRNGYSFASSGGGGGVMIDASSPRFVNCMLIKNATEPGTSGGGASIRNSAAPVFELCTFSGNRAASGAAVSVNYNSSPIFDTCTFVNNVATSGPSCGLSILNGGSTLVTECTLSGNSGAPGWENRAISALGSVPTITNTIVCDNDVYGDYTDGGGNCFAACSVCAPTYGDMDCDGVGDDADACAYGNEDDSDDDGTPDCEDLCPEDSAKIEYGACGCGIPDTDSDFDGVPDCNDFCPDDPSCSEYQITVCRDGCDFTSINAAIDSAADGDMIVLSAEHYFEGETIDFDRKGLTLRGSVDSLGNPTTILDGANLHVVLKATGYLQEGQSITLENLVIQNGFAENAFDDGEGGGLSVFRSELSAVTNCIFRNNSAVAGPGAARISQTSPDVRDCIFESNASSDGIASFARGGAVLLEGSEASLSNCEFSLNNCTSNGGAIALWGSSVVIEDSRFTENLAQQGGAIAVGSGSFALTVTGCFLTRNMVTGGSSPFGQVIPAFGAALYISELNPGLVRLTSCNVWCNPYGQSVIGPGPWVNDDSCVVTTNTCSDVCGLDSDADGVLDELDLCPGADDRIDTDQDGMPDCLDGCPLNPDKTDPRVCGCGPEPYVEGDLNCDGVYDIDDVRLRMAEFGIIEASDCQGDVNGDGNVDAADLGLLIGAWGICP